MSQSDLVSSPNLSQTKVLHFMASRAERNKSYERLDVIDIVILPHLMALHGMFRAHSTT